MVHSKIKKTFPQDNGYILSHRGTPSAGARHPIDIIVIDAALLVSNELHYYNPLEHSLNRFTISQDDTTAFIAHINEVVNIIKATILWFVAHLGELQPNIKMPNL